MAKIFILINIYLAIEIYLSSFSLLAKVIFICLCLANIIFIVNNKKFKLWD